MKKSLQIANPCHDNWDEMSAEKQGKFCDACAKTVIDFTNKSKAEIIATIEGSNDRVCGRYRTGQVDEVEGNSKFRPFPIAASLAGLAMLLPGQSNAQQQDTTATDIALEPHIVLAPFTIIEDKHERYVMGVSMVAVKQHYIVPFVRNEDLHKKAELNPAAKLYPNPAREFTTLELSKNTTYDIRIFDMQGKMVFNDQVMGTKQRINTLDYQPGMYFVNISAEQTEEKITLKLIVK